MYTRSKYKKGFTLIELVIVLAIIAILGAIVYPSITRYLESAKEKADKLNMEQIRQAAILYIADQNVSKSQSGDKIEIKTLIEKGYLDKGNIKVDNEGNIISPLTDKPYKIIYHTKNTDGDKSEIIEVSNGKEIDNKGSVDEND